jgi:hypothetical protein
MCQEHEQRDGRDAACGAEIILRQEGLWYRARFLGDSLVRFHRNVGAKRRGE